MKYSCHRKLLCELSKLSKLNAFILLGYQTNTDASILVYKFRPERTGFNMYAEYTSTTAINFPCISTLPGTAISDVSNLCTAFSRLQINSITICFLLATSSNKARNFSIKFFPINPHTYIHKLTTENNFHNFQALSSTSLIRQKSTVVNPTCLFKLQ